MKNPSVALLPEGSDDQQDEGVGILPPSKRQGINRSWPLDLKALVRQWQVEVGDTNDIRPKTRTA
jgi:hypothetical protein